MKTKRCNIAIQYAKSGSTALILQLKDREQATNKNIVSAVSHFFSELYGSVEVKLRPIGAGYTDIEVVKINEKESILLRWSFAPSVVVGE